MMRYQISSVKGTGGRPAEYRTLEAARAAAQEIEVELQPAFGVDITDTQTGLMVDDDEEDADLNGRTRIATPEELVVGTAVPEWARGAEARLVDESVNGLVDAWDLYRDVLVGCVYDDGSGYRFVEGQSIDDGDWADSGMPWSDHD